MARMTFNSQIATHVGEQIKRARDVLGASARSLGRAVANGGLSNSTVLRIEAADHGASLETLCLLALALGKEPAELLPSLAQLRKMFPKATLAMPADPRRKRGGR
jgi:transcriptional regulator with XRE-family HTH domain